ncbi:MAG: excalibur calcium-binding domain-containing protein [Delftia acidovorans]|nr:excalibur calcium-binding domain-containing protein [Delftia acidovorans]
MLRLIVYVLLAAAAWKAYTSHQAKTGGPTPDLLLNEPRPRDIDVGSSTSSAPKYSCDGRMHCSQMTSCEEAKFFLRNCPNTKMDGDGDGIPCERQLCN